MVAIWYPFPIRRVNKVSKLIKKLNVTSYNLTELSLILINSMITCSVCIINGVQST